ncbi:MAG TPA: GNAT family N-acetyltransferase [Terracidiphilus sp.]|nr:GNAT family N-acetyltransferase [Terracidiphilus sp.]
MYAREEVARKKVVIAVAWDTRWMKIRKAEPEDALHVARVHVRAWQAAYKGLLPEEYLAGLRVEDRAARYDFATRDATKPQTLVAVEGDAIVGFATTSPSRDEDLSDYGELGALYVEPERWGSGVGRELMAAARGQLAGQGFKDALLWVLVGNARAERFYGADGWRADGQRRMETVWGVTVDEVRYVRELG